MSERAILHFDLDSFFVSVERLKDSSLIGQPVIIGGRSKRGVVSSCSYETRKFGVTSAMPIMKALKLCPQAIVVSGDMESYSKYSGIVTKIIRDNAPLYQKSSIDEFYVDLSGMEKFFGAYKWAQELRNKIIKETGLPISFALASNKLISKIATNEAKPNGHIHIPTGKEKEYLAPLAVSKIPGVGEKLTRHLNLMGIITIQELSETNIKVLEKEFGKISGQWLWERANGIDDSEIIPYHEQKSMSQERTFGNDTTDTIFLKAVLTGMTENLAYDLRYMKKLTGCVTVKIRYSDFNTHTAQKAVALTANDDVLLQTAKELFDQHYDPKQEVRLIGIRFSNLAHGNTQINLFSDTEEKLNLYQAMDKIRDKFGAEAVKRAEGVARAKGVLKYK